MPANYTPEEISNFLEQFFNVVGTRQYIGARYVPLFGRQGEESVEWDNTAPYEPLTIVLYQGNSYTSRTYVPTGALLTDTRYWVESGNYNAQVEAYRRDVLLYEANVRDYVTQTSGEIDQLSDTIEGYHNLTFTEADIRRYGAVSGSENNDWASIISECAAVSDTIYFPAGTWIISDRDNVIDLSNNAFVSVVGSMAVIKVISSANISSNNRVDFCMKFNTIHSSGTPIAYATISGFMFECNGLANDALVITDGNVNVSNCKFIDYFNHGINSSTSLGKKIMNCEFGDDASLYRATQIAIEITTDSQVIGCKFFGQKICIQCKAYVVITGNLFYNGDDNDQMGIAINCVGGTDNVHGYGIMACNNQFDTIPVCFNNIDNGSICDNVFMWNNVVPVASAWYTIFQRTSSCGGSYGYNLIFSNNFIYNFSNKIIHTFQAATGASVPIRFTSGYVSEHNIVHGSANNLRICFGLGSADAPSFQANDVIIFDHITGATDAPFGFDLFFIGSITSRGPKIMQFYNRTTEGANSTLGCRLSFLSSDEDFGDIVKLPATGHAKFGLRLTYASLEKIVSTHNIPFEFRLSTQDNFNSEMSGYATASDKYVMTKVTG